MLFGAGLAAGFAAVFGFAGFAAAWSADLGAASGLALACLTPAGLAAASDLAASGWVGVSADAGNPVASARLVASAIDKANDKLIDRAVDRKAAARADWVTAFLRGESSIPLGTMSI